MEIPCCSSRSKLLCLSAGLTALIMVAVASFVLGRALPRGPEGTLRGTPTTAILPTPTPTPDETTNWKTYQGKYFSFKHPQDWTDNTGPAVNYPENIEVVGLRISQNAVFEASYKNYSFDKSIQGLADRKSSKLTVSNRETTRFELTGSGQVLPSGFSIISFIVKGTGDTSYSMIFNGDQKDITDELINQILSTFKFLD